MFSDEIAPIVSLSVSELTFQIKEILEHSFPILKVSGEISNWKRASSGHVYFSLKDKDSVISAVVFFGFAKQLTFDPQDGDKVIVTGNLSLFEKRGSYQIICMAIEKQGHGNLFLELERLKKQLSTEGLFAPERKRPIVPFPKKIVIITSPTGVAIRDILHVLTRRNMGNEIFILPSLVQGETAAQNIANQIRRANNYNLADTIILARGGGSLEDLFPFSEEVVVRAVANSRIPIITGIGHETDIPLADLAADLRAPTPSAAAEMACIASQEWLTLIEQKKKVLFTLMLHFLKIKESYKTPLVSFGIQREILNTIKNRTLEWEEWTRNLGIYFDGLRQIKREKFMFLSNELQARSPFELLQKGYAHITLTKNGKNIRHLSDVTIKDDIDVTFLEGTLRANVKEIL